MKRLLAITAALVALAVPSAQAASVIVPAHGVRRVPCYVRLVYHYSTGNYTPSFTQAGHQLTDVRYTFETTASWDAAWSGLNGGFVEATSNDARFSPGSGANRTLAVNFTAAPVRFSYGCTS